MYIVTDYPETFKKGAPYLVRLASASEVEIVDSYKNDNAACVITDCARAYIPMDELVDKEKELNRLNKEKQECEKEIAMFTSKLSNEGFISKAPKQVVDGEREKLNRAAERLAKINESIEALK